MAVFQLLAIDSPTTTGSQTYSHSLGVVPKAVIAFSQSASPNNINTATRLVVGVSDGSAQYSVSLGAVHGSSTTSSHRVVSGSLIHSAAGGNVTIIRADLTTWSATSLTLNWTTVQPNARRVYLLLIGGADVSAKALLVNSPTATGNQDITGVGFAPDIAIFLHASDFGGTIGTIVAHGSVGIGVAERFTPSQWAAAVLIRDNLSTASTYRAQRTDRCIVGFRASTTGTQILQASTNAWGTDGITLNWTSVDTSARPIPVLFLKGIGAKAFSFSAATASGSQSVTGLGFQPAALLLASFWNAATTSSVTHCWLSVGCATSASSEQSINAYDQNGVSPTVSYVYHATNRILVKHTSTVERTADLASFDADGFTLSWNTTGDSNQVVGLAFESGPVQLSASDTGTIVLSTEDAQLTVSVGASDVGSLTLLAESAIVTPIIDRSAADTGTLTLAGETAQVTNLLTTSDTGALTITGESTSLEVQATGIDTGSLTTSEIASLLASATAADTGVLRLGAELAQIESFAWELGSLRLAVGAPQSEPTIHIFPVLRATTRWELNDVGAFSAQFPVTVPGADQVDAGMEVRVVRQGEGEVYRGLIASRRVVLEDDGPVVEIDGYATARELAYRTTQLNWRVQNQSVSSAVANLLTGTGWSSTVDTDVSTQLVTAEFQGVTRFEAIRSLAQQVYRHVRPMPVERRLEVTKGEEPSGLRCILLPEWPYGEDDESLLPITRIRVSRRDEDIVTRVIPLGAGEGPNALTLRWSTRSSPYLIRTMTGPDGQTLYYLEDTVASATYGVRERVVTFKDVAPLANSPAELERAANVLYDLAAAWLQARKSPRVEWAVQVAGPFRQRDPLTGNWRLRPGNYVRLIARGVIDDWDGKKVCVDLDTDAFVRGIERRFENDAEEVTLTLTDSSRVVRDDDLLADVVNRVWALAVAQKTVPVREIHGPFRQTIDSGKPVIMIVDWDENVRFLHQAKLVIVCRRIRSNATTAASGGGATVTSQSGGGQTVTSAGGSGTTNATATGGSHVHTVGQTQNLTTWSDPGWREQLVFANSSAGTGYGVMVGRDNTSPTNAQVYMTQSGDHTHDVTLVLSNHSHSVSLPSHSHNVSLPSHTHGLVYGIFEGSYPTAKAIRVLVNGTDVTSALGGPWDPAENTPLVLDVTQWLQEPDGRPKQQRNRVEIQASALFDVEIVVKSLVAIATVVPV
jgi:hypothetical protein